MKVQYALIRDGVMIGFVDIDDTVADVTDAYDAIIETWGEFEEEDMVINLTELLRGI